MNVFVKVRGQSCSPVRTTNCERRRSLSKPKLIIFFLFEMRYKLQPLSFLLTFRSVLLLLVLRRVGVEPPAAARSSPLPVTHSRTHAQGHICAGPQLLFCDWTMVHTSLDRTNQCGFWGCMYEKKRAERGRLRRGEGTGEEWRGVANLDLKRDV